MCVRRTGGIGTRRPRASGVSFWGLGSAMAAWLVGFFDEEPSVMLDIQSSHGFIHGTASFFARPRFDTNCRRKFFNRAANRQPACKYGSLQ